jgi:hypothetical protein
MRKQARHEADEIPVEIAVNEGSIMRRTERGPRKMELSNA